MMMPAFVLGTALAATLMRHTRSAMLGVLTSDYVRTARAKGLRERGVVLKHALRNALTPIVTLTALLFGELLAGAVLTEQIFTIPGFGKLVVDAVFNRDYAVVQGIVLVTAVGFIVMNLLADVALRPAQPAAEAADDARHVSDPATADPVLSARPESRVWRKFRSHRSAVLGGDPRRLLRGHRPCRAAPADPRSRGDRLGRGAQGALGRAHASAPTRSGATCCRG